MKRNQLRSLILAALALGTSAPLHARTFVITVAPPPFRVYAQPVCPGDDYIWTPGHWALGQTATTGFPGAWVLAPQPGYLFTPGYWEFSDGVYVWHPGHWGLTIGYYGGVNYGFGYTGNGFLRWTLGKRSLLLQPLLQQIGRQASTSLLSGRGSRKGPARPPLSRPCSRRSGPRPEHREDERRGHGNDRPGGHSERNSTTHSELSTQVAETDQDIKERNRVGEDGRFSWLPSQI